MSLSPLSPNLPHHLKKKKKKLTSELNNAFGYHILQRTYKSPTQGKSKFDIFLN